MKKLLVMLGLAALVTCHIVAQAYDFQEQVNSYNNQSLGVNWANDSWFGDTSILNKDENYTNGISFTFGGVLSNFLANQYLSSLFPDTYYQRSFFLDVSQKMYTPKDYSATTVQLNSRPYAGYFSLGFYLNGKRTNEKEQTVFDYQLFWSNLGYLFSDPTKMKFRSDYHSEVAFDSIGVAIGTLGDGGAPWAQTFAHTLLANAIQPRGWSTHIANRLTLQVSFNSTQRVRLFGLVPYSDDWAFDPFVVYARSTSEVGNVFIRQTEGLSFHLGYIPHETSDTKPQSFLSVFLAGNGIFNIYDGTLDSQDSNSYNLANVPLIFEANTGIEGRLEIGVGSFLYVKFVPFDFTTGTFTQYASDGTLVHSKGYDFSLVRKFTVDYSY